jgi:hypothetical protein
VSTEHMTISVCAVYEIVKLCCMVLRTNDILNLKKVGYEY